MDPTYRRDRVSYPMGCQSYCFSFLLLKLRKEAGDREVPGGCSSLPYFLALLCMAFKPLINGISLRLDAHYQSLQRYWPFKIKDLLIASEDKRLI
jgi:hypothetical protein